MLVLNIYILALCTNIEKYIKYKSYIYIYIYYTIYIYTVHTEPRSVHYYYYYYYYFYTAYTCVCRVTTARRTNLFQRKILLKNLGDLPPAATVGRALLCVWTERVHSIENHLPPLSPGTSIITVPILCRNFIITVFFLPFHTHTHTNTSDQSLTTPPTTMFQWTVFLFSIFFSILIRNQFFSPNMYRRIWCLDTFYMDKK
jgi:hypothetical protein